MSTFTYPTTIIASLKPYFISREITEYCRPCDIYNVTGYEFYNQKGVYQIRVVYDYVDEAHTSQRDANGFAIVCIQGFDDLGYNHGAWRLIDYEMGITTTLFNHGDIHNERGWARFEDNFGDITKKYYLNGKLVTREMLEDKQRAAIVELLPQPIWEEVLEHYAIEV